MTVNILEELVQGLEQVRQTRHHAGLDVEARRQSLHMLVNISSSFLTALYNRFQDKEREIKARSGIEYLSDRLLDVVNASFSVSRESFQYVI